MTSPPWLSFAQKWPLVECVVKDIKFEFPSSREMERCNSIVAKVTLVVTRIPTRYAITVTGQYLLDLSAPRTTRHSSNKEQSFEVSLRNCSLPEFLVPSEIFERSTRIAWHQGVQIKVLYKEYLETQNEYQFKEYEGRVVTLSNSDPDWPHSPWDSLLVAWDDDAGGNYGQQRIGLWEAIPLHSKLVPFGQNCKFSQDEMTQIADDIDSLISSDERFAAFEFEVDSTVFPEYYQIIALPVYVDLIRRRLRNGFYRQVFTIDILAILPATRSLHVTFVNNRSTPSILT